MPRKVSITETQVEWLRENHDTLPYPHMAKVVGCCVDTLKRILVREGLQEFDGAKYQVSRKHKAPTWTRPCVRCACAKPRPKGFYLCLKCRRSLGYSDA